MFITQLGRQPELSLAELAAVFGAAHVTQVAAEFATVDTKDFDLDQLGGTIKYGEIITTLPAAKNDAAALAAASKFITATYRKQWQSTSGKLTLGLSAHNLHVSPRAVQKIGLILKATLKPHGVNLRLIPNAEPALSTATSHNNRLGTSERKIELLIIRTNKGIVIAESRGVQNITAYTHRDRHRPRRDAFVGMLPPKLAQIMLNLAVGTSAEASNRPAQSSEQSAARDSDAESRSEAVSDDFGGENGAANQSGESAYTRKQELIELLNYHLDLYDRYAPQTNRPFETLKRFFKIYIRDFDGAKELRDQLMHTKNTDEVRALLETA